MDWVHVHLDQLVDASKEALKREQDYHNCAQQQLQT